MIKEADSLNQENSFLFMLAGAGFWPESHAGTDV
jgi:hypothetical protein